jgi:hypothetical protein
MSASREGISIYPLAPLWMTALLKSMGVRERGRRLGEGIWGR